MSHDVRLRVAVQEQQRWTASRIPQVNASAVGGEVSVSEAFEHVLLSL